MPALMPNTRAVLLLCAQVGGPAATAAPLTTGEFHKFRKLLGETGVNISQLTEPGVLHDYQNVWRDAGWNVERIAQLLSRGAAIALACERWQQAGIWVAAFGDDIYPRAWEQRLGTQAPPLIFGVGDAALLALSCMAIVGSRDADEPALNFASAFGTLCAKQGVTVVSGRAKGVDLQAMSAAIDAGGKSIGILADGLARAGAAANNREPIEQGALLLLSSYAPEAPFTVGGAMGRNKLIYALADASFVVSAELQKGGTWSGATENLKAKWSPLFVRMSADVPQGNKRLVALGAVECPEQVIELAPALREWCRQHAPRNADTQTALTL